MKRVLVIGSTGSGKSTLAKALAQKLDIPYTDFDDLHHLPGWQERPRDDFRRLADEVTQKEKWIIAGNYFSRAGDITWPRADTVIWLDLPFLLNFWQLLKRTVWRSYTGEMICNGNTENFGIQFFSSQSILWWLLKTWRQNRKRYGDIFENPKDYPHAIFIRLSSHQQGRDFIDRL